MRHKVYLIYHGQVPIYAGRTSGDLLTRFHAHFSKTKGVNPVKKLSYFLEHSEKLSIALHSCFETAEEMYEAEISLIKKLRQEALENGWPNFNVSRGGRFDNMGYIFSEEQRKAVSLGTARAMKSSEFIEQRRAAAIKANSRPEVRQKIAEARKCLPGTVYPGTCFERIKGITPRIDGYRVEISYKGKVSSRHGFKTIPEAIIYLHQKQAELRLPLSTIPESYGVGSNF